MKRISTFVLASLVAVATYALPLRSSVASQKAAQVTTAPELYAPAQKATGLKKAPVAVSSTAADKHKRAEALVNRYAPKRNLLMQMAQKNLKPAAKTETTDTIFITTSGFAPEYYTDTEDWYMELYDDNGVYGVALDWFAPADNPYGSFTWEDMDSEHSVILNFTTYEYIYFEDCEFSLELVKTGKNTSNLTLNALIQAENGQVFVVTGANELLTPADTVPIVSEDANIAMANDSLLLLEATTEHADIKIGINSPYVVGEYALDYFNLDSTSVTIDGKKLNIWNAFAYVDVDDSATVMFAEVELLSTDTVVYNLLLSMPLPAPNDTIELSCPNLVIDDSWAIFFSVYFLSASAGNVSVDLIVAGEDPGVYTTAEGTLAGGFSIGETAIDMWSGKLTIDKTDGALTADLECYASDFNYYKIHMAWSVPEPTRVVDVAFTEVSEVTPIPNSFIIQFYNENDTIAASICLLDWVPGETLNFTWDNIYTTYTALAKIVDDEIVEVQVADAKGVLELVGDTTKLTATIIGFDSVQYNISMWYAVPVATKTVDIPAITDAVFTNRLSDLHKFQLNGATKDGLFAISFVPEYTTQVEGTFATNGKFTKIELDPDYCAVGVFDAEVEDYDWAYALAGEVVVTMDENQLVTATGWYLGEDAVRYNFTISGQYDKEHIQGDMSDTPVDKVMTPKDYVFELDDEYLDSYGSVAFIADGIDNGDMLGLEFTIDQTADANEWLIPAGEYEINDSFAPFTVSAGSTDGYDFYMSILGQVDEEGYLTGEGIYFLVGGTVTVENVGENDLHIVVDAWNSYDVPVKIDINTSATALTNVESEEAKAVKFVKNGQLYILRGEKLYNVLGAMAE
ncbi:MAG: hypothetical protein ACI397_02675 [Paludibacteraceae bacterium]